jgi:hypothetical protein
MKYFVMLWIALICAAALTVINAIVVVAIVWIVAQISLRTADQVSLGPQPDADGPTPTPRKRDFV